MLSASLKLLEIAPPQAAGAAERTRG